MSGNSDPLSPRAKLAVTAGKAAAAVSRAAGRGSGSVIGGRIGLMIDPNLRAAGPVVSNALGANMPAGITSALAGGSEAKFAAIEQVDLQAEDIVLVIAIWREFGQLLNRNEQAVIAQCFGGICIVDPCQLQNDHLTLIRPHVFNFVRLDSIRAEIDGLKLLKTIGDIGQRAHLDLSTNAKKGHHLSNSSPFGFL